MSDPASGTGRPRAWRTEVLAVADGGASPISIREAEVVLLAARGLSNREIASSLHISEATVKRHLANVYAKLDVRSRGQAACEALRRGLISAEELVG